jgi:hypothetical protein
VPAAPDASSYDVPVSPDARGEPPGKTGEVARKTENVPPAAFVPQLEGADQVTCTAGHASTAAGAATPDGAEQLVSVAVAASSTRESEEGVYRFRLSVQCACETRFRAACPL